MPGPTSDDVSDTTGQSGAQPSNRTIFTADNLPVLRGIDSETIDLIYLDPPFNTGKQWHAPIGSDAEGASFNDIWAWDDIAEAEGETLATSVKRQWVNALHIESPIRAVVETAEATAGEEMGAYLAFMAMRLVEMQRVLKPTGSIYLHCDDAANSYLRLMMDAIFGAEQLRNEIIWKRTTGRSDGKQFGRVHDTLLFYSKEAKRLWNNQYLPLNEEYVRKFYRHSDERLAKFGRVRLSDLTGPGVTEGESGQPWRRADPTSSGRHWSVPRTGDYAKWIEDNIIPGYRSIESIHGRLDALDDHNMLMWPKRGTMPSIKRYLTSSHGEKANDVITDIKPVQSHAAERTGYPTQKPLALLERIIQASSKPGDLVLDPFCGCATACVAAERLGRRWIGIDVSEMAALLCIDRIEQMQNETGQTNFGISYHEPVHRTDIPERTDRPALVDEMPIDLSLSKEVVKQRLYDQQEGECNGCKRHFTPEFADLMDLDHIKPKSKGGLHTWSNVQLLCRTCNVRKGAGTMAQLRKRLQQDVA